MIAKLIARTGALAGKDFMLPDTARIGAANDAEVQVRVDGVSRNHARMYRDGDHYWLEDAGSTNGTFLNGQRVQRERLRHLDVITLARNVDLVFVCKAGERAAAVEHAGVLNASLTWLDGPEANTNLDVTRGELTIGRAASCNIVVDSAAVSKVHARLVRTADQVTVQDLGSANGTFVNGKRVASVMVLSDRDRVGLAGVRNFVVHIERDPAAAVAAEPAPAVAAAVFDQEWKTRLVWSPEEMQELEAARAQMRAAQQAAAAAAATPAADAQKGKAAADKPAAKLAAPAAPRADKPAPGVVAAAGAAKAPPPVPPRAAKPAEGGEVKPPPPVPPRAAKPEAAGEAKAPPPLPPRAPKPEAPGAVKGPPPLPPRAAKPEAAAGEPKAPPPLPPRAPKPEAAAGEAKAPPPLPPRAAKPEGGEVKPPPPLPPRAQPPASATPASAAPPASGASPASTVPPAAASPAAPAGGAVPAPHTSQPPPERRTGPLPAQPRPASAAEGPPIRSVRLTGAMGTFTLEPGTYTVGRSETAEVRLDDREVSRAHAILVVSPKSATVEDQKSANGTFVNGAEITTRTTLRHGDKVMFGGLEFTVHIETSA